ncbi:MAG: acyltransferase [Lachnospiraceae bacterium]|nr:acyltransferase [Lachnospiraceae bacterium]
MDQTAKESYSVAIIDIIKAAACLMIFLYHCNTILPGEWKFLTVLGQDLGNNLFFMVSGFALAPSVDKTEGRGFFSWYARRLVRILPITVLAYIATYFMGYFSLSDMSQFIAVFIYPTLYWFISSILVFYIILFIIAKLVGTKGQILICLILFALFIVLSGRQERLYVIGLLAMIVGYLLRHHAEGYAKEDRNSKEGRIVYVLMAISFIAFIFGKSTDLGGLSYGLTGAGALGAGGTMLLAGSRMNESLSRFMKEKKYAGSVIRYTGNMALPLYLVQCFCSGYIGFWIGSHIDFPVSFWINFIVVWGIGTVLYLISRICARVIS